MPPFPPDNMSSPAQEDATTRPHVGELTRKAGHMPIIEVVHAPGSRHVDIRTYGSAHISTWPHAYTSTRPHGYNPYISSHPRRPG